MKDRENFGKKENFLFFLIFYNFLTHFSQSDIQKAIYFVLFDFKAIESNKFQ